MSNTPNTPPTPPPAKPVASAEELLKMLQAVQAKQKEQDAKIAASQTKATADSKKSVTVEDIDWTKIDEKDVFNLDLNIPAIEQTLPNYLDIHLRDKNYVARWVSTIKERLGPMRQAGFDYITKEDLDPDYPMPLEVDTQGHYTYADVVALKVPKSRYYPALRKNHLKSAQIQGANAVKSKIRSQIANNPSVEAAFRRGALSVYEDETKEDSLAGVDLSSVTL